MTTLLRNSTKGQRKISIQQVLLIEDDQWLAELQISSLIKAGYEVRHATNALDAVDMVDSKKPQAIVADVLLAGSTIFALLHELRSYDDTGEIPVILCTNMADQLKNVPLHDYGVKRVLDKSMMAADDVVAAVRAVI